MPSPVWELLPHFAQVLPAAYCSGDFLHLLWGQTSLLNFSTGSKDALMALEPSTFTHLSLMAVYSWDWTILHFFTRPCTLNKFQNDMYTRATPKLKFYTLLKKPKVVTLKIPENSRTVVLNVHSLNIYRASLFLLL